MNSIIKRCSIASVLALAVLMPDFRLLKTSPEGLALIADLEGCRLSPYRCSAGVWTSGIGHTAGVVSTREITERDAAANLIADVMKVEKRLAACAPVEMPPRVYDALVSFAFNVGTGAACRSTLVSLINRKQWSQACGELPRWVYVNGNKNAGLENRRAREKAWCLKEG
ncbi:lysozyme [Enterobacter cancerogenus]|uniref:lysozyme n=1 Tax=Enterobacter cancerogenus TaxID=69218 RepID=UPI001C7CD7A8|nr:lysozyme [Enterobacter cancerogenus]